MSCAFASDRYADLFDVVFGGARAAARCSMSGGDVACRYCYDCEKDVSKTDGAVATNKLMRGVWERQRSWLALGVAGALGSASCATCEEEDVASARCPEGTVFLEARDGGPAHCVRPERAAQLVAGAAATKK